MPEPKKPTVPKPTPTPPENFDPLAMAGTVHTYESSFRSSDRRVRSKAGGKNYLSGRRHHDFSDG